MDARSVSAAVPAAPAGRSVGSRERAALVRHKARGVLNGFGGKGNRLTLVLAVVLLLTVGVGLYAISVGLYMVGYMVFGDYLWLDAVTYALMGVLGLTLLLPLAASVFRLACLMTLRAYPDSVQADRPSVLPVTRETPELVRIFYPFTSFRAYRRSMAVGLEALGWTALWAGIPAWGFYLLSRLFDSLAERGVPAPLCSLMTAAVLPLCLGFGLLMLFLSGRRAGFGFFVFVHDQLTLGEVNRYFRGFQRSFVRPFVLRLSLAGWFALSVLAVLVPFVLHTVPYGLCCGAMYGAGLVRKDNVKRDINL